MNPSHAHAALLILITAAFCACGGDAGQEDAHDAADAVDAAGDVLDSNSDSDASTRCDDLLEALDLQTGGETAPPGEDVLVEVVGATGTYEFSAVSIDTASPLSVELEPTAEVEPDSQMWRVHAPETPGRYRFRAELNTPCTGSVEERFVFVDTPSIQPDTSSTLARGPTATHAGDFAVIEADASLLTVFGATEGVLTVRHRAETCENPSRVAWSMETIAVTCAESNTVRLHSASDPGTSRDVVLDYAAHPFAVVARNSGDEAGFVVASRFRRELYLLDAEGTVSTVAAPLDDIRGALLLSADTVLLSRWRSLPDGGSLMAVSLSDASTSSIELPFDTRPASDTENGGVPSYLDAMVLTPDGERLLVPGLQANIGQGMFLNGLELRQDQTLRAKLTVLERTGTGLAPFEQSDRIMFDDRGFASAVVTSNIGDYAFISMRGTRAVERIDLLRNDAASGSLLNVGLAPQAMMMTEDGYLLVHNTMSREVTSWKVDEWGASLRSTSTLDTVETEPLAADVLQGKVIFNDSFDLRITQDGYLACAHCHLDGESDNQTWDFTERGEGLRRTISLRGRRGTGHGPLHWSGNFDEVQDFENDMRLHFGGLGFLNAQAWSYATIRNPLGQPKEGMSPELDALASYLETFDTYPESPYRTRTGELNESAKRGADLFASTELDCTSCHGGRELTDSADGYGYPVLYDVGSFRPGSGQRAGGDLRGLDTPTLHALFNSHTYMHHGLANDLASALTDFNDEGAHGPVGDLTDDELTDLVNFLLSQDGRSYCNDIGRPCREESLSTADETTGLHTAP